MKRVVILQHRLLHYRVAFFEELRKECERNGICLDLVHGQATARESIKKDEGAIDWAIKVKNTVIEVGQRDIIWQSTPSILKKADLVIIMQESRIISNYPLLISRTFNKKRKIAYWGHGRNFQSFSPEGVREIWKKALAKHVDWWFAYTDMSKDTLINYGVDKNIITSLNNAIDTNSFKSDLASLNEEVVKDKRTELGIGVGHPVGIFCGSLYADKKLELLIEASDLIREKHPDFSLIVIGDGPSMPFMAEARKSRPWIKLLGVKKGIEKAILFRCADIMLNPGLVGLHIVDAFCASLVLITTKNAKHSPEYSYLKNGVNGFATEDTAIDYAFAVSDLFENSLKLKQMQSQALKDSDHYTINNMVNNFVGGIRGALAA